MKEKKSLSGVYFQQNGEWGSKGLLDFSLEQLAQLEPTVTKHEERAALYTLALRLLIRRTEGFSPVEVRYSSAQSFKSRIYLFVYLVKSLGLEHLLMRITYRILLKNKRFEHSIVRQKQWVRPQVQLPKTVRRRKWRKQSLR